MTVAVLAGGVALAACSSNSPSASSTSTSTTSKSSTTTTHKSGTSTVKGAVGAVTGGLALRSVLNGITKSSSASFSATYMTMDGATGQSQTVTFAQDPPKSAVSTPSEGSFYINGTSIIVCHGAGSDASCTSLPSSLSSEVTGLTNLFSPGVLTSTLKGLEAEAVAHAAGFSVSTSSATYGGQASTCVTVKGGSAAGPVVYCASNSNGILTYSSAGGSTVTLTGFTDNPPASTFSPPAGATVQTIPSSI